MEGITIAPAERKDLIVGMKRESRPSRRLRMYIVLLASEGYSATEIARVLYCSRTTLYAIVDRFLREGQRAFDDRKRRGPIPLVDDSARELLEDLTEGVLPTERGWLRSPASLELQALGLRAFQGASTRGKPREGAPRAPSARLSLEKASSAPAPQRLGRSPRAKAGEARRCPFDGGQSGIFLPGGDQAGDQPQGGFVLDAQR
jgi:DNA-binding MarR family transcriptional regulator